MEITTEGSGGESTEVQSGAEGAAEGTEGADAGGLTELLNEFRTFRGDVTSRFEQIGQRLPEPAAEEEGTEGEEGEDDYLDPSQFDDEDFTEDGALTPEAQRRALQQMIQRGVKEALAPREAEEAQARRDEYADMLEEQYPQLQDEKVQDDMLAKTAAFAQAIGQPGLAQEPQLLEMVFLAETARTRQGDEVPAGSRQGVTLERSGPAGPAQQAQQGDDGDRIVALGKSSKFRLGTS